MSLKINTCSGCGCEYQYDCNNPKGTSSTFCKKCQAKNAAINKKKELMGIACDGIPACFLCGYKKSVNALNLLNGLEPLVKPSSKEEVKKFASKQYVLCCNCLALKQSEEIEVKVNDVSKTPIDVSFFEPNVTVVITRNLKEVPKSVNAIEHDDFVVVKENEEAPEGIRTVLRRTLKISNSGEAGEVLEV